MNERIKFLRKDKLNMTQENFAEKINLKRNSLALIEAGRPTSDRTIYDICREFNVNEEWLRNGTGEIFIEPPTDTIDKLCEEYKLSAVMRGILLTYTQLSDEGKIHVEDFIQNIISQVQPSISSDDVVVISDLSDESKEEVKIFTDALRHSELIEKNKIQHKNTDTKRIG